MTKEILTSAEIDSYYNIYIDKISPTTTLLKGFEIGKNNVIGFFKSIPKEKLMYKYQSGKWSVKEILQHIIDTERIFAYRCFRIARIDKTPLSDFDQNQYVKPSGADNKSIKDLLNEYETNRNNSIALLNSLTNENLSFIGNSSGGVLSARAAAFIILGHEIWHIEVVKNKYL